MPGGALHLKGLCVYMFNLFIYVSILFYNYIFGVPLGLTFKYSTEVFFDLRVYIFGVILSNFEIFLSNFQLLFIFLLLSFHV